MDSDSDDDVEIVWQLVFIIVVILVPYYTTDVGDHRRRKMIVDLVYRVGQKRLMTIILSNLNRFLNTFFHWKIPW